MQDIGRRSVLKLAGTTAGATAGSKSVYDLLERIVDELEIDSLDREPPKVDAYEKKLLEEHQFAIRVDTPEFFDDPMIYSDDDAVELVNEVRSRAGQQDNGEWLYIYGDFDQGMLSYDVHADVYLPEMEESEPVINVQIDLAAFHGVEKTFNRYEGDVNGTISIF